jgi:DNA-binding transcriptional LysR family regulator
VPRGELTVTAPVVFGRLHIVPVISAFLAQFAEISVQLTLADTNLNLVDDQIDLAVRIGALPDSSLVATKVGEIRRVICGSPAYFAAHGIPKTPEDLEQHNCVTFTILASGAAWVFPAREKGDARAIRPRCRLRVNTAEAAIDAAIAGIGVTNVLSYQVARAVTEGKLRVVLKDHEPAPLPVHLVHARHAHLPIKMRSFLEFATTRLRKSLATDLSKIGAASAEE